MTEADLYLTLDERTVLRAVAQRQVRRTAAGRDMLDTRTGAGRGVLKPCSTKRLRELGFVAELQSGQVEYELAEPKGTEWIARDAAEVAR